MIWNVPFAPLIVVRVPSISAGLAASTATPGSTPPDESRTVPAMPLALCARAGVGKASSIRTDITLAHTDHVTKCLQRIVPPVGSANKTFRTVRHTSTAAGDPTHDVGWRRACQQRRAHFARARVSFAW